MSGEAPARGRVSLAALLLVAGAALALLLPRLGHNELRAEEGRRLLPSVVSFHPNGETLLGYEARERRLVDAENTVYAAKRGGRDRVVASDVSTRPAVVADAG